MLMLSLSAASESELVTHSRFSEPSLTGTLPLLPSAACHRHSSGSHLLPPSTSLEETVAKHEIFRILRVLIKYKKETDFAVIYPQIIPFQFLGLLSPFISVAIIIIH